jgi:tripartite-type tricarboxylate transporter receptor subunit TctC
VSRRGCHEASSPTFSASGPRALPVLSRDARAEAYPTHLVRWMIGFPPGGAVDIVARIMGHWLSEHFGQQFLVENRAGSVERKLHSLRPGAR